MMKTLLHQYSARKRTSFLLTSSFQFLLLRVASQYAHAYGVYRCNAEGELLDINQALLTMLGYESKEQLLAGNHTPGIIPSLPNGPPFGTRSPEKKQIEPVELEWKRKDGTALKVRLSGRGVHDDYGNFAGHEIIAVGVTEQRTLEDQLHLQASTDSLTGLANHRRLFEVLHAEICPTNRQRILFGTVGPQWLEED